MSKNLCKYKLMFEFLEGVLTLIVPLESCFTTQKLVERFDDVGETRNKLPVKACCSDE